MKSILPKVLWIKRSSRNFMFLMKAWRAFCWSNLSVIKQQYITAFPSGYSSNQDILRIRIFFESGYFSKIYFRKNKASSGDLIYLIEKWKSFVNSSRSKWLPPEVEYDFLPEKIICVNFVMMKSLLLKDPWYLYSTFPLDLHEWTGRLDPISWCKSSGFFEWKLTRFKGSILLSYRFTPRILIIVKYVKTFW